MSLPGLPPLLKRTRPCIRVECVAPDRHRLPRRLRRPSVPLICRPWGLQVAYGGGAGHPQHIAFAALAQLLAKPGVATQFIVTGDPAVPHLLPPRVEHLQALLAAS